MKLKPIVIALGVLMISFSAVAQVKTCYVSIKDIVAAMPEFKEADAQLAKYQSALVKTFQEQKKALDNDFAKFAKDSVTMTPAIRLAKRKDLQTRNTDLKNRGDKYPELVQAERERLFKPVEEKMFNAIEEVAKENGYEKVAENGPGIVFPAADDITERVKKKLLIK